MERDSCNSACWAGKNRSSISVKAGSAHRYSQLIHEGNRAQLDSFVRNSVRWTFWPSVGMAAVILLLGWPLLALFGPEFVKGYPLLFTTEPEE